LLRIDSHQHFWKLDRADYHWMPDHGVLHQDWLPNDLAPLNRAAGISATIAVQAAQTRAESEFLLSLADVPGSGIAGVVGWVDLESDDVAEQLEWFASSAHGVAIRPMLQDLTDPAWILRPAVRRALELLPGLGISFDLLSYPGHLPYAYEALGAVPDLLVIIDHLSKPAYDSRNDGLWREWIARFSERPNTAVKVSGMVTEPAVPWGVETFRANVSLVVERFGADRVMFGSDWPVCLQAASHGQVVALADELTSELTPSEQADFWAGTAQRFYRLPRM